MSRPILVAVLISLPSLPLAAAPEQPRAEGRIESGSAHVEILGKSYRVGETIQLPEGYLRVEEAGPEDEEVGSFTVVPASAPMSVAAAAARAEKAALPAAEPEPTAVPPPPPAQCRKERAAYLAEIWKQSGVEVDDPAAFLDAFEGYPGNPNVANLWFALSTDAFRTLAWSSDARAKANALSRCMAAR
jgi:hypothetical protein